MPKLQAKVQFRQKCNVLSHPAIWWSASACVALASWLATPSRCRRARLRAVAARRVGKMRTRWPRCRRSRRVAPYTCGWEGASHPGPLFTKHLPCPQCSTWLSLRSPKLTPSMGAGVAPAPRRHDSGAIVRKSSPSLQSNVRENISRVAELSARLRRLMERKPSVLCLTETWSSAR